MIETQFGNFELVKNDLKIGKNQVYKIAQDL